MIECLIHKVAKTDRISGNECQSCEFFGEPDCPMNVYDNAEQKHMAVSAEAWEEVWGIFMRHFNKKIEGDAVKKVRESIKCGDK